MELSEEWSGTGIEAEEEEEDRVRLCKMLLMVSFKSLRRLVEEVEEEDFGR